MTASQFWENGLAFKLDSHLVFNENGFGRASVDDLALFDVSSFDVVSIVVDVDVDPPLGPVLDLNQARARTRVLGRRSRRLLRRVVPSQTRLCEP